MKKTFCVAFIVTAVLATWSGATTAQAAAAIAPVCRSVFNEVVNVSITLAPGESVQFDRSCSGAELFGIRGFGARTGSTPATAGTTEYSNDGTTWVVDTDENGWNPPLTVRYTAPTNGAVNDSFYVYAGAVGTGSAGYLYNVTIADPSIAPDLSIWHQAIGRASQQASCPEGYGQSWAAWPNGGTGGWTCVRDVLMYGP